MPLITCPDCDAVRSDASPACPECGRLDLIVPAEGRALALSPACPRCGAAEVRELSAIHFDGMAMEDTGVAPPRRKNSGVPSVLALIGVILLLIGTGSDAGLPILLGLGVLGLGVYRGVLQSWWNREVFPTLKESWDSTLVCTRCKHRFIP